jgi:glycosyltransferase involved in cell wall biosynthesis
MKVLFLVQKEQRVILDRLYGGIAAHCECDTRWLDDSEQRHLRRYFKNNVEVDDYDRILLFLRFKQEIRQVEFIASIPNLVILEHDAYQNYIPCKYAGCFSKYYRRLPWARVICSGFTVTEQLRAEGVDAVFVPKGYDGTLLRDEAIPRDIELAFVGSLKSSAYDGRRKLLEALGQLEPLMITRTKSGEDYLNTLNRIRYFVSADVGMGEYMIKNFEAMACGCVLLAYNQGDAENMALGFIDMENLVLYSNVAELREKLAILRETPALADRIARQGRQLAETNYEFARLGACIVDAMKPELRYQPPPGWVTRWRNRVGI